REGTIGEQPLQKDIQRIARGMRAPRLANLLQGLVSPIKASGIPDGSSFRVKVSLRPHWPLVDSRVEISAEDNSHARLLLGTRDGESIKPFIFRETLTSLFGASLLKALESGGGSLSALRQQVRQRFGINTGTIPDGEQRPLGLTRQYALTLTADHPSKTSLYQRLVKGHHNLQLAEGTEADYRRALQYLRRHDSNKVKATSELLSKGEVAISVSDRTLFNKVINEKNPVPAVPSGRQFDNTIATYSPLLPASVMVDVDYRAWSRVGSGLESLLDSTLLGLSRAAAENLLSQQKENLAKYYPQRLIASDYLKSLLVHFIYWKMDQVLGSNGQPASQIHQGVTDAVTAILPDSDIRVIK
ncbi:hypothetical protein, partial [Endozoicomonas sp. ONNA1]|uniref:hypothetical protein n=1 Tax=Endozoicomonas sp. ONNA1 TaxID=2828740 RepID=UPI0021478403